MNARPFFLSLLSSLFLWAQPIAAQNWAAQAPPYGRPDATIDLRTREGVQLVKGNWRYSDVKIIEVDSKGPGLDLKPSGDPVKTYDYTPHVGLADFGDSQWPVVDPTTLDARRGNGKISFNWYCINVALPEKVASLPVAGSTVSFEIVIDDYAEIWVNGNLSTVLGQSGGSVVKGWNAPNKVILTHNAQPGKSAEPFEKMASMVQKSFSKFWNPVGGCCYDVIEDPQSGNDASLRPNQIFAVSLPESPLSLEQQKAVVDVCGRRLLTSHGLRSLAPGEPGYQGHYGGGPRERDGAYHQGTAWGWLLGPFVFAHLRVYGDRQAALSFLEPLGMQIFSHGLGTLSEIYDGDAPFTPRGCIAQAWTVAEALRAWRATVG